MCSKSHSSRVIYSNLRIYQNERIQAVASILIAVGALRFLYTVTLKQPWRVEDIIAATKRPLRLPVVLSPDEVLQFLACVPGPKHRAILTTCLRGWPPPFRGAASATNRYRQPPHGHSRRSREGPERSLRHAFAKFLELLGTLWRVERSSAWLLPDDRPGQAISKDAVEHACQKPANAAALPSRLLRLWFVTMPRPDYAAPFLTRAVFEGFS